MSNKSLCRRKAAKVPSHSAPASFIHADAHFHSITCMSFSDDCTLLATGGSDSSVRVWSLTDADLMGLQPGDQIAKRNVTGESAMFSSKPDERHRSQR